MSRARLSFGVLSITVAMLGTAAAQPADLPAGPNRDVVSRACQACHDLSMVVAATGLSREGWNATIEEMISYGMRVTSDDRAKILDYLSSYLGSPSALTPASR
jgi:cytochrome c5